MTWFLLLACGHEIVPVGPPVDEDGFGTASDTDGCDGVEPQCARELGDATWRWTGSADPADGGPAVLGSEGVRFVGDLSGDGLPDLAALSAVGSRDGAWIDVGAGALVGVASSNGAIGVSGFATLAYAGATVNPREPGEDRFRFEAVAAAGDATGDGRDDLWVGCETAAVPGGSGLCLLAGPLAGERLAADAVGSLPFAGLAEPYSAGPSPVATGVDVDGSGTTDVLTLADQRVLLFLDPGAAFQGEAGAALSVEGRVDGGGYRFEAAALSFVGDVDGDGVDDFAVADLGAELNDPTIGDAYLFSSDLVGTVTPEAEATAGFRGARGVSAAGDFNGDGYADLLFDALDGVLTGPVSGTDAAFAASVIPVIASVRSLRAVGDVDGDGFGDLVARLEDGRILRVPGASALALFDADETETAWLPEPTASADSGAGDAISVADFDGDGLLDLATAQPTVGADPKTEVMAGAAYVIAGPDWW